MSYRVYLRCYTKSGRGNKEEKNNKQGQLSIDRLSTINSQLSTLNYQLSTLNYDCHQNPQSHLSTPNIQLN
ncbi:MAG: hypothetical protein ACRC62_06725 [Microcoleus sp.]